MKVWFSASTLFNITVSVITFGLDNVSTGVIMSEIIDN